MCEQFSISIEFFSTAAIMGTIFPPLVVREKIRVNRLGGDQCYKIGDFLDPRKKKLPNSPAVKTAYQYSHEYYNIQTITHTTHVDRRVAPKFWKWSHSIEIRFDDACGSKWSNATTESCILAILQNPLPEHKRSKQTFILNTVANRVHFNFRNCRSSTFLIILNHILSIEASI